MPTNDVVAELNFPLFLKNYQFPCYRTEKKIIHNIGNYFCQFLKCIVNTQVVWRWCLELQPHPPRTDNS
jgi:hypothetical protein